MAQANSHTLTPEQQLGMGGQLRETQRGVDAEKEEKIRAEQPQMSLRQRLVAARRAMDIKQRAKDKIEEKVMAPARMGTNYALRWAWLSIGTVFGFIFIGLPYINLHVFGRYALSDKLFCKLGDEWKPAYKDVAGAFGQMGRAVGIVEVMALLVLDLAVLAVIAGVLVIIVLIVKIIENPAEAVDIFGFGFIWEAIKALF